MKKLFYLSILSVVTLSSCTKPFKKLKDGSEYKVILGGDKGAKIVSGNFFEMNVLVKYKDSVLYSSIEAGMPQYGAYELEKFPTPYKEAFKVIHVGDSIVIRMSSDSLIAKGQAAPFMKKGQFVLQTYKITNMFTSKEQADSAQKTHVKVAKERMYKKQLIEVEKDLATNKAQVESDSKMIEAYLAKNNIKAVKGKWGTFVAIQTEGTGNLLTAGEVASVNYTGKSFDSSISFDSNTDPKFGHTTPYDVNLGQLGGVIIGWHDALMQMKKGTKATVYIPSSLGYGKMGRMPSIKPDAILVFDMEIVDVLTEEALLAKQELQQKIAQEEQMRMMDSIAKTRKDTAKLR
ncbi:MAG: FKBP-type peptidyl-prolyl cis-trans isomerase [Bacteroidota bacterium]